MSKKFFFILLIFIMSILNLGKTHIAQASEPTAIYSFKLLQADPLYASVNGNDGCPDVREDTALYQYALPVTPELLADLQGGLAAGYTPGVVFKTVSNLNLSGQGAASYTAQVTLAIRHANGNLTILHSETKVMPGDNPGINENITGWKLDNKISQLEVGDTLLIGGTATGVANSVDCDNDDQATVSWEMPRYSFDHTYNPDTFVPYLSILCNNEVVEGCFEFD